MNERKKMQMKLIGLFTVVVIGFCILTYQFLNYQLFERDQYYGKAVDVLTRSITLPAKRGSIVDRNGENLAYTVTSFSVWVQPSEIVNPREIADLIGNTIYEDPDSIYDKIVNSKSKWQLIARDLEKDEADLLKQQYKKGVSINTDVKRVYPNDELASHVLGTMKTDQSSGEYGVEIKFDDELGGEDGVITTITDAVGRRLPFDDPEIVDPVDGVNVVLTIDTIIQRFLETELLEVYNEYQAKGVVGIVMDPNTGEILAMSTKPDFDPNDPRKPLYHFTDDEFDALPSEDQKAYWYKSWNNQAISTLYEPGSTFKLLTTAAALEENLTYLDETFFCEGHTVVADRDIKCWVYPYQHGEQTLVESLENSCNVTMMELGRRLGDETFYQYLRAFGITDRTGISLPAEGKSQVYTPERMGPVELATNSFGHGISITPLQLITAVSAVVNGGTLYEPHIVKAYEDSNGNVVNQVEAKAIRQVISEDTSSKMRYMMQSVVENGSGKLAYIPGIDVGGKTGTAEKLVKQEDGTWTYDEEKAYASFVGFAPVDDPEIVVLVVVDEPLNETFGSKVAAPVVHDVMVDVLRHLKVRPEVDAYGQKITLPDLTGMTYEKATDILDALELKYTTEPLFVNDDESLIANQFPKALSKVDPESLVILYLEED